VQVHAVLQATISRLALLAVIVVDPHVQAQELTQSVGEEISRMIQHQKELEAHFHELIAAQPALRALPNKANLRKNQAELQEVSAALRQATKQLCRCDSFAEPHMVSQRGKKPLPPYWVSTGLMLCKRQ
jgi:hypothetical protein